FALRTGLGVRPAGTLSSDSPSLLARLLDLESRKTLICDCRSTRLDSGESQVFTLKDWANDNARCAIDRGGGGRDALRVVRCCLLHVSFMRQASIQIPFGLEVKTGALHR